MIPIKRTPLSAIQRVEVWRRWKAGESLHAIGRALGKDHVVVHLLLKRHGGITPRIRRRSRRSLTLAARLERKHQRAPSAVPAEEGGSVLLLAIGAGRDRTASESTATKDVGISNSGG